MIGGTSFFNVYYEIFQMGVSPLGFTKQDIDDMPPFEREGYIQMLIEAQKEKETQNINTGAGEEIDG